MENERVGKEEGELLSVKLSKLKRGQLVFVGNQSLGNLRR
jgi:hypothetical protein